MLVTPRLSDEIESTRGAWEWERCEIADVEGECINVSAQRGGSHTYEYHVGEDARGYYLYSWILYTDANGDPKTAKTEFTGMVPLQ